jgi:hypothetical protein
MCNDRQLLPGRHVDAVELSLDSCGKDAVQRSPPNGERRQMKFQVARTRCADGISAQGSDFCTRPQPVWELDRMLLPYITGRTDSSATATSCGSKRLALRRRRMFGIDGGLLAEPQSDHQQDTRPFLCAASISPRQMPLEMLQLMCQLARPAALPTAGPRHGCRVLYSTALFAEPHCTRCARTLTSSLLLTSGRILLPAAALRCCSSAAAATQSLS